MSDQPPLGRFYEVGGRRLLLYRSGRGRPAVVILPDQALPDELPDEVITFYRDLLGQELA